MKTIILNKWWKKTKKKKLTNQHTITQHFNRHPRLFHFLGKRNEFLGMDFEKVPVDRNGSLNYSLINLKFQEEFSRCIR